MLLLNRLKRRCDSISGFSLSTFFLDFSNLALFLFSRPKQCSPTEPFHSSLKACFSLRYGLYQLICLYTIELL